MTYTFIPAIPDQLEIPEDGTLSRILYRDDRLRVVGFAFDGGQELTEHTAAVPALIQVLTGRLRMEAHLAHSLRAIEPSVVLLTMLSAPK